MPRMNAIDHSDIDGRLLQVLLAVVEERSVTRAAARLDVTQSAVSHQLDRLRAITGDPLFVKSGRGIVATARAEALALHARRLLDELRAFAQGGSFDAAGFEGPVTIAANDLQRDLLLPLCAVHACVHRSSGCASCRRACRCRSCCATAAACWRSRRAHPRPATWCSAGCSRTAGSSTSTPRCATAARPGRLPRRRAPAGAPRDARAARHRPFHRRARHPPPRRGHGGRLLRRRTLPARQRLPGHAARSAARQPAARLPARRRRSPTPPMPMFMVWHQRHEADAMHRSAARRTVGHRRAGGVAAAVNCRRRGEADGAARPAAARRHPLALRATASTASTMHVLEAGSNRRPARRAAAARLPGARLQLAQGDAAAGRRPATTWCARPARLRPHHRLGRATTTATWRRSGLLNLVRDAIGLARGARPSRRSAVVGHDFGSPVAAWCALVRPDVFRSRGADERAVRPAAPSPRGSRRRPRTTSTPRSRRCRGRASITSGTTSTREANADMRHCAAGRARFPARLLPPQERRLARRTSPSRWRAGRAEELAQMPTYYVMDLDQGMAETVAPQMPTAARSPPAAGCPTPSWRSTRPSTAAPASRAACTGIAAHAAARAMRRAAALRRPHASTCRRCSSRARATGASTSARRAASACSKRPARSMRGST